MRYCLWYSDDKDGFYKQDDAIVSFGKKSTLEEFVKKNGLILSEEEVPDDNILNYDVDFFCNWLQENDACNETPEIACSKFLNLWNIVLDIAHTLDILFYGDEKEGLSIDVYNKLFYGCNLPVLRGAGEIFIPQWDDEDIAELRKVITDCIKIINQYIFKNQ